jgi:hypothetical protein
VQARAQTIPLVLPSDRWPCHGVDRAAQPRSTP